MAPIIALTGATDGIGYATARSLCERGATVLIHGRSEPKARRIVEQLQNDYPKTICHPLWADLTHMPQVVDLAAQIRAVAPTLDVLINNAGVYTKTRQTNSDGFELHMCVNHFAHFLLVHYLTDLLSTNHSRIINVSSMTHAEGELDLSDLNIQRQWDPYTAYATSKQANILFTNALARAGKSWTANALHPGVIATKLLHAGFGGGGDAVEQGAKTSVYLALDNKAGRMNGEYFVNTRKARADKRARDPKLADALWEKSLQALSAYL